jgi:hypothetical protein
VYFLAKTPYFCYMKKLIVRHNNDVFLGSIKKIADYIGVHSNTVSRWVNSGDRRVIKNGFEIFLKVKDL